jgi:hypothetical protein
VTLVAARRRVDLLPAHILRFPITGLRALRRLQAGFHINPTSRNSVMNRPLSIALLVVGVVLLIWGFNASESVSSEVSEAVTGAPSDRSIWLIALGGIAALVGGITLLRRTR